MVLVLSALHVDVTPTLAVSSAVGLAVAAGVQHMAPDALAALLLHGFAPENAALAALMQGGGILSMAGVFSIVLIASTYSGIFRVTGLLDGLQRGVLRLAEAATPFAAAAAVSTAATCVSCNQTLAIMLTRDLCAPAIPEERTMALTLANTAVVIAALVPWSIAGAVPLTTVGAPPMSLLFAFYLWLIPLWNLAVSFRRKQRRSGGE